MFFENDGNIGLMKHFLKRTQHADLEDEKLNNLLHRSRVIVKSMSNDPEEWEYCTFSIEQYGVELIDDLSQFDPDSKSPNPSKTPAIEILYATCFRFLSELSFKLDQNRTLSDELRRVWSDTYSEIDPNDKTILSRQLVHAIYVMPISILGFYLGNKRIQSFLDFEKKIKEAEDLKVKYEKEIIDKWSEEIEAKHKEINHLNERLEKTKNAFNFVGLYDGFSNLEAKKKSELNWQQAFLCAMSFLILSPMIYQFFTVNSESFDMIKLIPLASMELVLLYFFRIILMNYRSTKAQIMQIELRQTMCQFIQSYSEYASEMKAKDKESLDKFENLIFSGILSDPEKLPSTFDGINQISNLIKNLKTK